MIEGAEPACVEALVAQPAVEALDMTVLHRSSRLDMDQRDTLVFRPGEHAPRGELNPAASYPWCYGSEFTGQMLDLWAYRNGVKIDFSRPGKPTDNAFCESFNGTLRSECLDTNWFQSLAEAKLLIEAWRQEYNVSRPHRALADRTPAEFASQIALKRDLTETKTGRELTL